MKIRLKKICGSVYHPRHQASRDMDNLFRSILSVGLLNPITVREEKDGYRIVCGHRRVEALEQILQAGKASHIPAGNARLAGEDIEITARVLKNISDLAAAVHAFVENEEREDLTPLDKACFYRDMVIEKQATEAALALQLGIGESTVRRRISLLESIPGPVLEAWKAYRIGWGHVQYIMSLETRDLQLALLEEVVEKDYNVVETEMAALRLRQVVPDKEILFHGLESRLYKDDRFAEYVRQGRIRMRGSRQGKWMSLNIRSAEDLEVMLRELLEILGTEP